MQKHKLHNFLIQQFPSGHNNHCPGPQYCPFQRWAPTFKATNMLLQQKSGQMDNNLAEQQVNNNNNKAKAKGQTQEQISSPLSQVLKTYDFGNLRIVG